MKNTVRSIAYAVSLFVSASVQAGGAGPLQALAEEHGRQSLAAARTLVKAELGASLRPQVARFGTGELVHTALTAEVKAEELPCTSSQAGD